MPIFFDLSGTKLFLALKDFLVENSDTGDNIKKSLKEECDKDLFFFVSSVLQQIPKHHLSVFRVDVNFKQYRIKS